MGADGKPCCDQVKSKGFVSGSGSGEERPYLRVVVDRRGVMGLICGEAEVCWSFPLSYEKFRLRVEVSEVSD